MSGPPTPSVSRRFPEFATLAANFGHHLVAIL
jgi:hypothetical protein